MALDRFIRFGERRPTQEETELVLRDFFGPGAAQIKWDEDRFFITLPGKISFPFASLPEAARNPFEGEDRERWIEVFISETQFDVITRAQDEYTNTIAEGLTKLFARYWEGEVL